MKAIRLSEIITVENMTTYRSRHTDAVEYYTFVKTSVDSTAFKGHHANYIVNGVESKQETQVNNSLELKYGHVVINAPGEYVCIDDEVLLDP